MKTSFITMMMICLVVTSVFSQSNLNDYKYVIVAKKYDFLKEADQYQLNSLSKFLFNKYGFEALMEGEKYPEDLLKNRCLALNADALKDPGMFKTKISIELTDCNDQVVYTSGLGISREKEYKKSYTEAIRDAFKSFEEVNYKYQPKENTTTVAAVEETVDKKEVAEEIQQLRQEIASLKKEKVEVVNEKQEQVVSKTEVKILDEKTPVVKKITEITQVDEDSSNILYAQETENGFQLVDSSPKVVYKIIKTGVNNVFLVEGETAIIYKKVDSWILESSESASSIKKELNIKF
ncbi:MAG: hypothetical protein WA839_11500 [Flavobacteriaceae bacterium]